MAKYDRRAAYKARVRQAGSVKAAEQDMREVVNQYQQNLAAGMTPGQAATSQGNPTVAAPSTYTVTNTDNISTVANALNTNPTDLLNANPDITQIQTGMVINAPAYTAGEKNYNPTLSNNASYTPPYMQYANPQSKPVGNNFTGDLGYAPRTQQQGGGMLGLDKPFYQPASGNYTNPPSINNAPPPLPQQPTVTNKPPNWAGQQSNIMLNNLLDKITAETGSLDPKLGRYPSDWEMKLLIENKRVVKVPEPPVSPMNSGGYGYYGGSRWRGGKGGRGSGGGNGGRQAQQYSQPPFSTGAGFRGLVNWRL